MAHYDCEKCGDNLRYFNGDCAVSGCPYMRTPDAETNQIAQAVASLESSRTGGPDKCSCGGSPGQDSQAVASLETPTGGSPGQD